jgi:hypothetical protein
MIDTIWQKKIGMRLDTVGAERMAARPKPIATANSSHKNGTSAAASLRAILTQDMARKRAP